MSSIIPTNFKFINMSTGSNGNSNADQRKCTIRDILKNESPTLVFVEEFTWAGLHEGSAFSELNIPTHYKYVGNWNAGFIIDSRYMDCERLDLKSSVRRSYGVSIAYRSSEINFDLPRLCICKIKSKRSTEFELLCVCWHGPHNNFSDEKKEKHLLSMLRFLLKVKVECGNLPLLLGGDFNLDSTEVDKVCKEVSPNLKIDAPLPSKKDAPLPSKKDAPLPSKKDAPLPSIMMWIHLPDFHEKFKVLASKAYDKYEYFDHYVLIMEVQLCTPVEDFKRRYTSRRYSAVERYFKEIGQAQRTLKRETDYFKCRLVIQRIEESTDFQMISARAKKESTRSDMISASWHGGYDEYSDEVKEKSLRATIDFLLGEVQKHVAENPRTYDSPLDGDIELDLNSFLKEPTTENLHCRRNTLDTWTLSNNDKKLLEVKLENQRPMKWKNETHHLQRMSTPHQCPTHSEIEGGPSSSSTQLPSSPHLCPPHLCPQHSCPLHYCPQHYCPPHYSLHYCPPHYCPLPTNPPDERAVPNGNPVDIHLDIVDLKLRCSGKYIFTLDGYLKKCVYLQPKSPEQDEVTTNQK